jgi:hypothetical protein
VHSTCPPVTLIRTASGIHAQRPIRAAADHFAVVIVLAVVFPAAFAADLVAAALGEGRVAAAWAGIWLWPGRSIDVPLIHIRVEPGRPALNEFLVREARVIPWPSMYGSLRRVVIHAIQYGSEDRKAHIFRRALAKRAVAHPAMAGTGRGSRPSAGRRGSSEADVPHCTVPIWIALGAFGLKRS